MPDNLCKHCGLPESDHHTFEPIAKPAKCKCDPAVWENADEITQVCGNYEDALFEEFPEGYCKQCYHPKDCHEK